MYIIKNAWTNITRSKGRNVLIGSLIMVVTIASCIALGIYESGTSLVEDYQTRNSLEVRFTIDRMSFRSQEQNDSSLTISPLTEALVKQIGSSNYLNSYYYTLEESASSSQIEAVSNDFFEKNEAEGTPFGGKERPNGTNMGSGDYRFTAYSDVSYIDQFLSGVSKITSGSFFSNDSTEPVIVINEELATKNNLSVGDTVTFYQDSESPFTLTIVGIYTTTEETSDTNFMNMNAMNQGNQIYTNLTTLTTYFQSSANNINARFYLKNASDLDAFETEARSYGLSDYYQVVTNEEELLKSLEPIQNLSKFSMVFFCLIVVVGGIIIAFINMIQIRERKYEVGVLRAIGMRKRTVIAQVLCELMIVGVISLTLGTGIGTFLSQPVTDHLLSAEIAKQQTNVQNVQENFGGMGGRGERPQLGSNEKVVYVESLTVSTNVTTIFLLFITNLGLILIGGAVCAWFINQYEPNKILQNRT